MSQDAVTEVREQRKQAELAVHQREEGAKLAQSAKVLSETDTQNPNALTDLLGTGASVV